LGQIEANEFRDVIGHFASGVTIITAVFEGERYGTTASAVSSLSLEPPMLLVCMNKTSTTGQAIAASGRFAVNVLREDQPDAAIQFAMKGGDKFKGLKVTRGISGALLLDDALATCECRVVEDVTGGTHSVFLAEVDHASARPGAPLAYFRGRFGRLELEQDESAFREIRARVINRQIPLGEPLDLDVVAQQANVPRGSAYHALTKLLGEGLVRRNDDGGFVVIPLTLEALQEGLRARCAIELGAAQLSVGTLSAEELSELGRAVHASYPAPERSFEMNTHLTKYRDMNERFMRLTRCPALLEAYRRVDAPAMITSLTAARAGKRGADRDAALDAYQHHLELLTAYEKGDCDAACAAIERHIRHTITYTKRYMDAVGGQV
jgi:flavin reductase (DIM6/NTAB) family NADH-FMN oxidoreductase RutF/DNA-binding FadR family transcriptional regulator